MVPDEGGTMVPRFGPLMAALFSAVGEQGTKGTQPLWTAVVAFTAYYYYELLDPLRIVGKARIRIPAECLTHRTGSLGLHELRLAELPQYSAPRPASILRYPASVPRIGGAKRPILQTKSISA